MNQRFEGVFAQGGFKSVAGNAAFKSRQQTRPGSSLCDIPVFRFRLTLQLGGHSGRWMDLQAEPFAAIKPFYENGKRLMRRISGTEQVGCM